MPRKKTDSMELKVHRLLLKDYIDCDKDDVVSLYTICDVAICLIEDVPEWDSDEKMKKGRFWTSRRETLLKALPEDLHDIFQLTSAKMLALHPIRL